MSTSVINDLIRKLKEIFPDLSDNDAESRLARNAFDYHETVSDILREQDAKQSSNSRQVSRDIRSSSRDIPSSSRDIPSSSRDIPSSSRDRLLRSRIPEEFANLKQVYPSLTDEVIEYYLVKNKGDYNSALEEIMTAQEEQASITGSELDTQFEDVERVDWISMKFDEWIDAKISSDTPNEQSQLLKSKLTHLFGGKDWDVINPRGDGFCGLYSTTWVYDDAVSPDKAVCTRNGILDKIMSGIKKYFKAREQHIKLQIPLPEELQTEQIYIEFKESRTKIQADGTKIFIQPVSMTIKKKHLEDPETKRKIKKNLAYLKILDNIPSEVFVLLAYAYKQNYLILRYDTQGGPELTYYATFIPCYLDVTLQDGKPYYPYAQKNTVMFNDSHYFLFHNPNLETKFELINTIKANRNAEWSHGNRASGLKKIRKATYKNNLRKSKLRKSKLRKSKLRKSKNTKNTKNTKKQKFNKSKYLIIN